MSASVVLKLGSSVDLTFLTEELRKICESRHYAHKVLGPKLAEALIARLADIEAAETADELVAGDPQFDGDGTVTISLDEQNYLYLKTTGRAQRKDLKSRPEIRKLQVIAVGAQNG